jgi:hypothetical protein
MNSLEVIPTLNRIRQWADAEIASGVPPPWAWYQYMKLIETIDAICRGFTTTKGHSLRAVPRQERNRQQEKSTSQKASAQPHVSDERIRVYRRA